MVKATLTEVLDEEAWECNGPRGSGRVGGDNTAFPLPVALLGSVMPILASTEPQSALGMASSPLPRHPTGGIEVVIEGAMGRVSGRLPAAGLGSWTRRVQGTGAEAIAKRFMMDPCLRRNLMRVRL